MSAPLMHTPLTRRDWFGYLTTENHEQIAERLSKLLDGRRYTFVSVHDGHPGLTSVRTSQKLAGPMRVTNADGLVSISFHDNNYAWGIHTSCTTQQEARDDQLALGGSWTYLSFNDDYRGTSVEIRQLNGFRELLQWIVMLEAPADEDAS